MTEIWIVVLAYLIGSIPMAYLIGRTLKKIDIRRYGSGNVGTSNIWVHVGKWVAIPLAAFDIFVKGAFPVYLAQEVATNSWIVVLAGLATVAGHNWSLYLKFTGGRGITVVLGVLLVLAWKELAIGLGITLVGWLISRSSALWVGISVALIPVLSVVFGEPLYVKVLCVALLVIAAVKRVMSNRDATGQRTSWRNVFLQRLIYDRDVASRDDWIYRAPPET
ncbi:MAG: glycerol-3-phosphate acyltransferase PlsY [Chloroflexi bacterium]|nr:MAG: glycerol-3-phosphate acyltransferase PlsY [Chloroflexota bacterium]